MSRRLPWTLWWYIGLELTKLVLLTTVVLVTVIAFAAAVKPLADGKLGPNDALKFMVLAMVPMLQYALPFAACFGATLAYHRFASDNEMNAAFAGGVSHRSILAPAIISGVVLAGALLGLSNEVIPRFLKGMSQLVTQDAAKWIVGSIQRGEALQMQGTLIYADMVARQPPKEDDQSTTYERLYLEGVLVVRLDDKGRVDSMGSAKQAAVWLRRVNVNNWSPTGVPRQRLEGGQAVTEVIIKPTDVVAMGPTMRGISTDTVMTFQVPNAFSDNVKFRNFFELQQLRREPERIDQIDKSKRSLALVLAEREMIEAVGQALKTNGVAEFKDPFGQPVFVRGSGVRNTRGKDGTRNPYVMRILPLKGSNQVVVEKQTIDERGRPGAMQRLTSNAAFLRLPTTVNPDRGVATANIQLMRVLTEQVGGEGDVATPEDDIPAARGEVAERPLTDLSFVGAHALELAGKGAYEVRDAAVKRMKEFPSEKAVIEGPLGDMNGRVLDMLREVLSKEHERYAMSLACLVMVVIGSVMAMRLRDALPLTVYLWAFFPALACVLAISGGQQLTHGQGTIGLVVLYAGVAGLGLFAAWEFVRVCRH